jgi:dTDP-D-glucose 4,6-dehydratase
MNKILVTGGFGFIGSNFTHLKISSMSHIMVIHIKDTNLLGVTDTNLRTDHILKLTRV